MLREIKMLSGLRGQSPRHEKRELTTGVIKVYSIESNTIII